MLARSTNGVFSQPLKNVETRYLAFQIFTSSPNPAIPMQGTGMTPLGHVPSEQALDAYVTDIVTRIGTVGEGKTRLAIIFGPLAFDQSDAQVRQLIDSAFAIALKHNVAVGFHIDDSMFWAARKDLWSNPANVEWMDWDGTPCTGRRIDWGPHPSKIPPQMCFNSPIIQAEVRRRGAVIGAAIQAGRARLAEHGKSDLFAAAIVGSEAEIGQDFDTGNALGYHALVNRGFSKEKPPADPDAERVDILKQFITLWGQSLIDAGVPPDKIYTHIAFLPLTTFEQSHDPTETYAQRNHFGVPAVAFGPTYRPGFSTYPQPGFFEQVYAELDRHGDPPWASCEGTDLQIGSRPGESGMNMETYLAKMFNHGAVFCNIFSWGVGGEAHKNMDFRVVTEGPEAIAAYRKFLSGAPLIEAAPSAASYVQSLPDKVHLIQSELPDWVQRTGGQAQVEPLMKQLAADIKAHDFPSAETVADKILAMIKPPATTP